MLQYGACYQQAWWYIVVDDIVAEFPHQGELNDEGAVVAIYQSHQFENILIIDFGNKIYAPTYSLFMESKSLILCVLVLTDFQIYLSTQLYICPVQEL